MQLKLVFHAFSVLFLFLLAYVFTENLNIVFNKKLVVETRKFVFDLTP